jgi:hypothetical protein
MVWRLCKCLEPWAMHIQNNSSVSCYYSYRNVRLMQQSASRSFCSLGQLFVVLKTRHLDLTEWRRIRSNGGLSCAHTRSLNTNWFCGAVLLEKLTVTQLVKKSPPFMEPEGSLPCSLVPSKHKPTDLCNWDAVCFLGGLNWMIKINYLKFVTERIMKSETSNQTN